MNYEGLLAQLTEDKLKLFDSGGGGAGGNDGVQEGAILEEQAATIQTIPCVRGNESRQQNAPAGTKKPTTTATTKANTSNAATTSLTSGFQASNANFTSSHTTATPAMTTSATTAAASASAVPQTAVTMTPQRKISTSSRFMSAFTQFYNNATNTATGGTTSDPPIDADYTEPSASSGSVPSAVSRTPTKGMESKLMSMWHNVKYGWSGKIRSNFSKEQPVWLLGRCYHRKSSPPNSMENSTTIMGAAAATSPSGGSGTSLTTAATATELDNMYCGDLTSSSTTTPTPHLTYVPPNSSSLYPQINYIDEIIVPQELGMDAVENQVAENPWEEGIEGFKRDFYSRLWMTYRREFQTMNGSNYTSDCGWGCMLRSGQMLLAQGLICHFLGRNWRYDPDMPLNTPLEDSIHRKIIKWFGDSSSKSSPFSIHALVHLGQALGKKPGDWYGPSSVSHLLRRALQNAAQENADFDNIAIYVARDCTIYMQDVEELCRIPEPTPKHNVPWQTPRLGQQPQQTPTKTPDKQQLWKSLILLIPLRLGTEKLNTVYAHCLKLLLSTEYCIGIIGGRPKHSLYFVGFQEDRLIHLDPHYCQEMVDVNQENFPLHSFHCKSPRKLKTSKMDPSCCIGFYCATKTDFDNFVESVQPYLHPMRCASGGIDRSTSNAMQMPNTTAAADQLAEMSYPLFSFSRGRCLEHERDEMSDSLYKPLQKQLDEIEQMQNAYGMTAASTVAGVATTTTQLYYDDDDGETEEFVLL